MRTEFRAALATARQHDNPNSRIEVIKQAVSGEVSAVDPTVHAHFTDYFNHVVAPDIVLQWPNENRERFLFVRPTGSADRLLQDMRFITQYRPLVFTLEDFDESPDGNEPNVWDSLSEMASAGGAWITDSSGTEAISRVRQETPTLALLSQALVRGGRGVSNGEEIASLTNATEAGFAGATNLSVRATRSAVEAIEGHLDEDQSGRLTRLLRAIWESRGGDLASFPPTATVGKLTEEDLSFLLETTSNGSEDFWHGIGRAVDTVMLGRLQITDPSSNLQMLMHEILETIQAKGLRLFYEPLRMNEVGDTPRWLVSRECLALRGPNWTAYVAAKLTNELPPADNVPPPDLSKLMTRAGRNPVTVTQVRLRRGDRVLSYKSEDGGDVLGHPGLSRAAEDLNVVDIEGVVAPLPGGGNLGIDFPTNTATGITSATFLLGPLVRAALPLLSDFSPAEWVSLRRSLRGAGYQQSLFEDEE